MGYAVVQCISRTKRSAPNSRQTRCLHQPASSLRPRPSGAEPLNPRSGHAAATAVRRALRPAELPVTFTTVSGTACLRAFRRALALQASAIVATPIAACNPYPYISHHAAHVYSRVPARAGGGAGSSTRSDGATSVAHAGVYPAARTTHPACAGRHRAGLPRPRGQAGGAVGARSRADPRRVRCRDPLSWGRWTMSSVYRSMSSARLPNGTLLLTATVSVGRVIAARYGFPIPVVDSTDRPFVRMGSAQSGRQREEARGRVQGSIHRFWRSLSMVPAGLRAFAHGGSHVAVRAIVRRSIACDSLYRPWRRTGTHYQRPLRNNA